MARALKLVAAQASRDEMPAGSSDGLERFDALLRLAVEIAEVRDLQQVLDTAIGHCLALTGSQFAELRRLQIQRELDLDAEELRVLRLIVGGASNEAIGQELSWSVSSVKRAVTPSLLKMCWVSPRAQASAEAVRRGVV